MENLMESHEILMNSPMMVHGGPGWLENSHEILMKIPYNLMEFLDSGTKFICYGNPGWRSPLKLPETTHTIP
jgi:hypothetical protein